MADTEIEIGSGINMTAMLVARAIADTLEVSSKIWRVLARDILLGETSNLDELRNAAAKAAQYAAVTK